jgi:hypothetical protein
MINCFQTLIALVSSARCGTTLRAHGALGRVHGGAVQVHPAFGFDPELDPETRWSAFKLCLLCFQSFKCAVRQYSTAGGSAPPPPVFHHTMTRLRRNDVPRAVLIGGQTNDSANARHDRVHSSTFYLNLGAFCGICSGFVQYFQLQFQSQKFTKGVKVELKARM